MALVDDVRELTPVLFQLDEARTGPPTRRGFGYTGKGICGALCVPLGIALRWRGYDVSYRECRIDGLATDQTRSQWGFCRNHYFLVVSDTAVSPTGSIVDPSYRQFFLRPNAFMFTPYDRKLFSHEPVFVGTREDIEVFSGSMEELYRGKQPPFPSDVIPALWRNGTSTDTLDGVAETITRHLEEDRPIFELDEDAQKTLEVLRRSDIARLLRIPNRLAA